MPPTVLYQVVFVVRPGEGRAVVVAIEANEYTIRPSVRPRLSIDAMRRFQPVRVTPRKDDNGRAGKSRRRILSGAGFIAQVSGSPTISRANTGPWPEDPDAVNPADTPGTIRECDVVN